MRETEPVVAIAVVGAMDASASPERRIFVAPCACRVVGIDLVDSTAKAAHADNKGTYAVKNKGAAGDGTTVVATRTTVTGNSIVANVAFPLTLSTTKSVLNLAAGTVLTVTATEAGTATSGDLVDAIFAVRYVPGSGSTV